MVVDDAGLLERREELETLGEVVDALGKGAGRFVVVEGPAGIGKTRLLAAARTYGKLAGVHVIAARGTELEQDFAFGVVRQLIEPTLVRADEAERAEFLSGAAVQAAGLFGAAMSDQQEVRPSGDFALLHGLYWLVSNMSQRQPVLLVVDDLHWADAPSLRFLLHLLPRMEDLPVAVVAGLRSGEPWAPAHLLELLTNDAMCQTIRPASLSRPATERLLRDVFGQTPDSEFTDTCHLATAGNPLLLTELADALAARKLTPSQGNAAAVEEIGSQAVTRIVNLRLAQLSDHAAALARATAVLGEGTPVEWACALASLQTNTGDLAVTELAQVSVLHPLSGDAVDPRPRLGFVHPLVRAAVEEGMGYGALIEANSRASELLIGAGAPAERVAAHLLKLPPRGGPPQTVQVLREAARTAADRGSPAAARSHLQRCLQEPLDDEERVELLVELGTITQMVDLAEAAEYLRQALAVTGDPLQRALIAWHLSVAFVMLRRSDEVVAVVDDAIARLPESEDDLCRALEATVVAVRVMEPGRHGLTDRVARLSRLPPSSTVGGRMLDSVIAYYEASCCDTTAVDRALRSLSDNVLGDHPAAASFAAGGWNALTAADHDIDIQLLDAAIKSAHRHGSLPSAATAYAYRGLSWLRRGALAEAETDLREAVRTGDASDAKSGSPIVGPHLAETLIEQGRLSEAHDALVWAGLPGDVAPPTGLAYHLLLNRARLLRLKGDQEQALKVALAAGRRFADHGGNNPAYVPWLSEAALCLNALEDQEQAEHYAEDEVALAQRWGAPRALGRALRVAGLVRGGDEGLSRLQESVTVLAPSTAQLEYAKSLSELGAALRRTNQRRAAREPLLQACELASRCGAKPLLERSLLELHASGARPRRMATTGVDALTPAEQRIAELAATGQSNRDIAQSLFVTAKTVEVHLSSAYRKLGISGRRDLVQALEGGVSRTTS
ncbi:ATP-binding protein [Streptomyces sp. CA-251387]|uniref:ATP-binding protein n=1 Tax=Streptomyces sp. CA-251387 TaxID=3240064 RepID=UPI003D94694B